LKYAKLDELLPSKASHFHKGFSNACRNTRSALNDIVTCWSWSTKLLYTKPS